MTATNDDVYIKQDPHAEILILLVRDQQSGCYMAHHTASFFGLSDYVIAWI
jgi:hypothetical protein